MKYYISSDCDCYGSSVTDEDAKSYSEKIIDILSAKFPEVQFISAPFGMRNQMHGNDKLENDIILADAEAFLEVIK